MNFLFPRIGQGFFPRHRGNYRSAWGIAEPLELRQLLTAQTNPILSLQASIPAAAADTTPPTVLNCSVTNGVVTVEFSEDMAVTGVGSVLDKNNWRITSDGVNAIQSTGQITFSLNSSTTHYEARIPVSDPQPGKLFAVFARGTLLDKSGNALDGNQDGSTGDDFFWTPPNTAPIAGTPDGSFGDYHRSYVTTNFFSIPPRSDVANGVFYSSSSGKYTVVGVTQDSESKISYFGIAQYKANGSLDMTFGGGDGKVTTDISGFDSGATCITIDATYGILVGGYATDSHGKTGFAVARYDLQGNPVATFGQGGKATVYFASGDANVRGIAVDPTAGRVILVGSLLLPGNYGAGVFAALKLADGKLDTNFNGTGSGDFDAQFWSSANAVVVQADGTTLIGGSFYSDYDGDEQDAGIVRLKANGTIDTSFPSDQISKLGYNPVQKLEIRDGRIIAYCWENAYSTYGSSGHASVLKLMPNGTPDNAFDGDGILAFPEYFGRVHDMAVSANGRFFVALEDNYIDNNFVNHVESRLVCTDPTFATSGVYSYDQNYSGYSSVLTMDDGRVVVAGYKYNSVSGSNDFRVDRLTNAGNRDGTFDADGVALTDLNQELVPTNNYAEGIALQTDGKLISIGKAWNGTNYDLVVTRNLNDGQLDKDFAVGGRYQLSLGGDDLARSVVVQPDGKILIAGTMYVGTTYSWAFIVRLNSNGTLDKQVVDYLGVPVKNEAYEIALQPDGKILVAGKWQNAVPGLPVEKSQMMIVRLNAADLSHDTSFASNGVCMFSIGDGDDVATSVVNDGNGRIVAAGWGVNSNRKYFAVASINAIDGSLDTSFSGDGKLLQTIGSGDASVRDLIIDKDLRIVVLGDAKSGTNSGFAVARINSNGALDPNFGPASSGIVLRTDMTAARFASQGDDKFVIAGNYGTTVTVARLKYDGSPDPTFWNSTGTNSYLIGEGSNTTNGLALLPDGRIALIATTDYVTYDADVADFALQMILANGPPEVSSVSAPVQVVAGSPQPLKVVAKDPAADDNAARFMFNFDWNADGIFDEHLEGTKNTNFTHVFSTPGYHQFRVSATDRFGATGPVFTTSFTVPLNDLPVVSGFDSPVTYTENSSPVLIDSDAVITDQLSPDFNTGRLTLSITANSQPTDLLSIRHQGTAAGQIGVNGNQVTYGNLLIGSFTGGSGSVPLIISLNSAATPAVTQVLLRNIVFSSSSESPSTLVRTIQVGLEDGDGGTSAPVSKSLTLSPVNDAPVLNPNGLPKLDSIRNNITLANNPGTLVSDLIARMSPAGGVSDVDAVTLLGVAVNGLTNAADGSWQFSINNGTSWTSLGTTENSNARLLAADPSTRIRFVANPGFIGRPQLSFVAWDRSGGTNGGTADVASRGGTTPYSLLFDYAEIDVRASLPNSVGYFQAGKFSVDGNNNRVWDGTTGGDSLFAFGAVTDIPVVGDWNGDGISDIGTFRKGKYYLDANGNHKWDDKPGGDLLISFGDRNDIPLTGDWNGDGISDIGSFRNGAFYLDANGNRKWDGNSGGDQLISFGIKNDLPVVGDWNGDGISDIGVYRTNRFYLDANGNRAWNNITGGDVYFDFGTAGDKPVSGDWNADGKSDIGIVRNGTFYLDANGNRAWNNTTGGDVYFNFGSATDIPLVGFWKLPTSAPLSGNLPSLSAGPIQTSGAPLAIGSSSQGFVSALPTSSVPPAGALAVSSSKKRISGQQELVDQLFAESLSDL